MTTRGRGRRRMPCFGLSLAAALLVSWPALAERVTLLADQWCPYNCVPGSDKPGFMVEIAREALAEAGHTLEYRNLNWMRSLHKAEKGEVDGVIGAVPAEAPDFVFGPALGSFVDSVAVRRGQTLDLSGPNPLAGMTIGAINGYEYYGPVAEYIEAHADDRSKVQFASGDDPLEQNLRKLVAGRVDAVAEVDLVLLSKIAELGLQDEIDVIAAGEPEPIFVAFSPALPKSERLAHDLAAGLATLRASGRLDQIMARYGLEVWE